MTCKEYIKKIENENKELRREKLELKEKIESFQSFTEVCFQGDMDHAIELNIVLKKENEWLRRQIEMLQNISNSMTKNCSECSQKHKYQIEKMKCCQNCEFYDCTVECRFKNCKYQYSEMCRDETMYDKWELAE